MTDKNRKALYCLFKYGGVFVSCLLPILAILERYPIWKVAHGANRSIGAGGILIFIVLIVVFRKSVFNFMRDRLNLKHAPPLMIWLVMLAVSYVLIYIAKFLHDMTSVFWMGFIGCAIGTFMTFIAENRFGKENDSNGGITEDSAT